MIDPAAVTHWIDRRLYSANTWLEQHGRHAPKPRPELDIENKEQDVAMFEYVRGCFQKALDKRNGAPA